MLPDRYFDDGAAYGRSLINHFDDLLHHPLDRRPPVPAENHNGDLPRLEILLIGRPTPKTGRNEPCACKSDRKFKQCCLQNEANPAAHGHAANQL